MRRLALILMFAATALFAQEHGEKKAEESKPGESKQAEQNAESKSAEHKPEDFTTSKWVNFAILAVALGYLIGKSAPQFFRDRTASIQKDMEESAKVASDAEARAKAVEAKISRLGEELERMKADARADMARENERLQKDTAKLIERVWQRAENEVESAAKVARLELKQYAAQLAVDLAEQRIRTRLNPETQGKLIDTFVQDLGQNGTGKN